MSHWRTFRIATLGLLLASCGDSNPVDPAPERAPVIGATYQSTEAPQLAETVELSVTAADPDGDSITFTWEASGGALSAEVSTDSTSRVLWKAPLQDGDFEVEVRVTDGQNVTEHVFQLTGLRANTLDQLDGYLLQRQRNLNGLLRTYDALDGRDGLENRYDIYDSALAAIFLTAHGNLPGARAILDAFVALSDHGSQLLSAAYNADGGVLDWKQDTGNNAYAVMALMQYVHQHGDAGGAYEATARALMAALAPRRCDGALGGFRGEAPANWRSIEHNVDMFAAGQLLGDTVATQAASTFVEQMWVPGPGQERYNIGTAADAACTDNMAWVAVPTDAQMWTMLSDADGQQARKLGSVNFAVANMYSTDLDESGSPVGGFLFTNGGTGIQLENTASGAMALARYLELHGTTDNNRSELVAVLEACRATLLMQLSGNGFVPATVLEEATTGLGWSYYRTAHVAATAWTGLLVGYFDMPDRPVDERFNPYTLPPGTP